MSEHKINEMVTLITDESGELTPEHLEVRVGKELYDWANAPKDARLEVVGSGIVQELKDIKEAEENLNQYESLENQEFNKMEAEKSDVVPAKKETTWSRPMKRVQQAVERTLQQIPVSMQDKQVHDLTPEDIRKYICPLADEKEAFMFLKLCQARGLNPFTKEAYLIKYKQGQPASTVVGKDAFTRRAEINPQFDGYEAGIILRNESGDLERREGTFLMKSEVLLGGWAKVYRKDRTYPFVSEVSFDEYAGKKAEYVDNKPTGNKVLNSMWEAHGPTMIRKVPLVQSLREAFPGELGGLYDMVEMNTEEVY